LDKSPFYRVNESMKEATEAFRKLGEAAAMVEFPDLQEIRRMRMNLLKARYGLFKFILPEYYKWLIMK